MKIESKDLCPLNGFEKCRQLDCAWFILLRGHNPNTGEDIDEWGCAIAWQPLLSVENSQQQRHTAAAVESLRNEIVGVKRGSGQLPPNKDIKEIGA